ncbi:alpha/beta hydrolase [bacterium]|nr:alpha/beta hydrolase [bacterium]
MNSTLFHINKHFSTLLLFLVCISFNISGEVISDFERCLRFNANHLTNSITLPTSSNLGVKEWVSTFKESESTTVYFIADHDKNNLETPEEQFYTGIWPTFYPIYDPETGAIKYEINVNIICQWDITNNTPVFVNNTITNRLLKTPHFSDGNAPEDDTDIYVFSPEEEGYCIEMPIDSHVELAITLDMSNYEIADFGATCYSSSSEFGPIKRYYKNDWIKDTNYYLIVRGYTNDFNYYRTEHNYQFTIRNVRPIILIHGIFSNPTNTTDQATAFSEIKNDLPYIYKLCPVSFYDFPWDHMNNEYIQYTGSDNYSLFSFTTNICLGYYFKPVVISHSMGGMLVVRQIINKSSILNWIKSFVFFGTPFCGANAATYSVTPYIIDVSPENLYYLKRGTKNVWDFMSSIPYADLNNHNSAFIIGKHPTIRKYKVFWKNGGKDCDGVVPISSANLPNTLEQPGDTFEVNYNHIEMKNLKHPYNGDYLRIFNKLKNHID